MVINKTSTQNNTVDLKSYAAQRANKTSVPQETYLEYPGLAPSVAGTDDTANFKSMQNMQSTQSAVQPAPTPTQPTPQHKLTDKQDPTGRLSAMSQFLGTQRDGYLSAQEAALGKARDEQVAQLQKALEDAVAEGSISVREAETAFTTQKAEIEKGAYQQSEATSLAMGDLGIQNSAQGMGLMQGDNARKNTMINKNVTERDLRISTIKDRVNAIKNKTNIDLATAGANYNYGLAGARGQADMQYGTQMFDMLNQDHQVQQGQDFQRELTGNAQDFEREMTRNAQSFQSGMADKQQAFTLEQFAVQQGYNLQNMSVQQRNQLEQMYEGYRYNYSLQNNAQEWQSGEKSLDRGHQQLMQNLAQTWQSGENALNRDHDYGMLGERYAQDAAMLTKQWQREDDMAKNMVDEYALALERELRQYTPGTDEHTAMQGKFAAEQENLLNSLSVEARFKSMNKTLEEGGIPTDPGKEPVKPTKTMYEKWRGYFAKHVSDPSGIGISSADYEKKLNSKYEEELKIWKQAKEAYKTYQEMTGGN